MSIQDPRNDEELRRALAASPPDGTAPERAREAELLAALKPAVTMLDWALRTLQIAPIEVAFASAYAENCRKAIARGRAVIDATRPPDGMPGEPAPSFSRAHVDAVVAAIETHYGDECSDHLYQEIESAMEVDRGGG